MSNESDSREKVDASASATNARREAADSSAQTVPPPAQPPLDASRRANAEGNGEDGTNRSGGDPHAARQVALNRWLVGATFVIAGATVIYMIFSGLQWHEIRSGGQDTRRLADAAQRQANAASQQVNAMQGQLDTMRDQANSMRAQTNTLKSSLDETKKATNAAVTQANASMSQAGTSRVAAEAVKESTLIAKESLRPIVTSAIDPVDVKDTEMRVRVQVRNDGGSKTEVVLKYCVLTDTVPNPNHSLKDCGPSYVQQLGPSVIVGHGLKEFFMTAKDTEADKFVQPARQRKVYMFILTVVEYSDFGKRSEYPTCAVWREDYGKFGECSDLAQPRNRNPK